MENLTAVIAHAQSGDLGAYGTIVRRFQDMAVGYAYAVLGDFHLAEDAAQEAFIEAYLGLSNLREPAAFSSWFRRIVFKRCDRLTRGKRLPTVPLETERTRASTDPNPAEIAETNEMRDSVLQAIRELPEREREVTTLFYIDGYSQNEIGAFLEVPARTVKSRLHTARNRLRERMMDMVEEHLHGQRPSRDDAFASGVIDDLARFTDRDIQMTLREVDSRDLGIAMREMSEKVKARIFANVSPRVRTLLEEETVYAATVPAEDVEEKQAQILRVAQRLVQSGQVIWPPPEEEASERKPKRPPSGEYLSAKNDLCDRLRRTPFSRFSLDEVTDVIYGLARVARTEGILMLDEIGELTDEGLLRSAIRLIVDGTEPKLIQAILSTRSEILRHHYEMKCKMVIEGLMSILSEDPPRMTEQKLQTFYMSASHERDTYTQVSISDLKDRLGKASGAPLGQEGLTDVMTDMAIIARTEGIDKLREIADLIDENLLAQALKLALDRTEPRLILTILETRMRGLLHQLDTRHKMIMEGILSTQAAEHPRDIAQKTRYFYEA